MWMWIREVARLESVHSPAKSIVLHLGCFECYYYRLNLVDKLDTSRAVKKDICQERHIYIQVMEKINS